MKSRRWGEAIFSSVLVGVVAATPLVILPGALLYFDTTPKVAVVLLGTAAALLLARNTSGGAPPPKWFQALLVAQGASLALSTLLSVDRALSVTGTNWRRFGLVAQAGVLLFSWLLARHIVSVLVVLRTIAISGVLCAIYGIAQYFGWDPWLPAAAYQAGEDIWTIVRPPGTLGHATYFGTYLLAVQFAGLGLAVAEHRVAWRILGTIVAPIAATAIVLSGTRSAMLGLLLGAAVFPIWSRSRIPRWTAVLVLGILALGSVFYLSPAGRMLRNRVHWSLEDASGGARLELWRDTIQMARAHWVAGAGPETFTSEFARVQSRELSRAYPDFHHESPHNVFLDALAAQGAIGAAILALFTGLVFRAAWRARAVQRMLSGALAASFAGALVSLQFQSFTMPTALFWYVNAALLATLAPGPGWRFPRMASVAATVCAAGLLIVFAARLLVADRSLALVKGHLDNGRIEAAVAEHKRVLQWQPPGMNAELWYSRSLLQAAQRPGAGSPGPQAYREALDAAIRATSSSEERHNAYYNLAAVFAVWNDPPRTIESLRRAIAAAPTWYKSHWVLAQVLGASGRLKEADAEAALAIDLCGGKHPEVYIPFNGRPIKPTVR